MPMRCFVTNCTSGYDCEINFCKHNGLKPKSLFKAPKDPELLRRWQLAIPRLDKILSSCHFVCEKHFSSKFIERFYRTKLKDGSEHLIPRERAVLLPDAVPTKFPGCPKYLSKQSPKKRKPPSRGPPSTQAVKRRRIFNNTSNPVLESEPESTVPTSNLELESASSAFGFTALQCAEFNRNSWSKVTSVFHKENYIRYLNWPSEQYLSVKYVDVDETLSVRAIFGNVCIPVLGFEKIENLDHLNKLLDMMEKSIVCPGAILNQHQTCRGYISSEADDQYCGKCKMYIKAAKEKREGNAKRGRRINQNMKKRMSRLQHKVKTLKERLVTLQRQCANLEEETLFKKIDDLDLNDSLKENIRTCINVAKAATANGIRYSQKWLFECILLKIKNTKAYEHVRVHHMMPVPSPSTISRYLRQLKPTYGFQTGVFEMLKAKAPVTNILEREGCLLLDEMKLHETFAFDKQSFKILGFTDLGKHTPQDQKEQLGNHAMVLMYQPFSGGWVQPIGAFLSQGAAPSTVLYEILIEAVVLLEKNGFMVDAITADGAQPNRGMWKKFGVNESKVHCQHIYDENRKLWFISDFPHLIKCMRNWMTDKKSGEFKTPDGVVKLVHWKELLEAEKNRFGLRASYKLSENHLSPKVYEKMNVTLAYQLFDYTMADGMELYKNEEGHEVLKDCEPTCKFIRRVRKLINAMSSRTPKGALRSAPSNSVERKTIEDFLIYFSKWENMYPLKKKERTGFISNSTMVGMKVTLTGTLELLEYVTKNRSYSYLMTARLNQDNLEKFFGMIRAAGGNDDHPDSIKFMYLFKLLSTYTLLKPPRGSNVPNGEIFTTFSSIMNENKVLGKEEIKFSANDIWSFAMDHGACKINDEDELIGNYDDIIHILHEPEFYKLEYIAGYVVRKVVKRFTKCKMCLESLQGDRLAAGNFLSRRDKFQVLHVPSADLVALLSYLEKKLEKAIGSSEVGIDNLKPDTFFHICRKVDQNIIQNAISIGCSSPNHRDELTTKIVHFYLMMRINFVLREAKKLLKNFGKTKALKKKSKLIT